MSQATYNACAICGAVDHRGYTCPCGCHPPDSQVGPALLYASCPSCPGCGGMEALALPCLCACHPTRAEGLGLRERIALLPRHPRHRGPVATLDMLSPECVDRVDAVPPVLRWCQDNRFSSPGWWSQPTLAGARLFFALIDRLQPPERAAWQWKP